LAGICLQSLGSDLIFWKERFSCPICLDLLKDPTTLSCGHNYCMSCITKRWDEESQGGIYTCPQCRQMFRPKPVLGKNTMLADFLEELKKTRLEAAPHPHLGVTALSAPITTGTADTTWLWRCMFALPASILHPAVMCWIVSGGSLHSLHLGSCLV
uniref:RING-type domain-containing protein n=1 Tax=Neolamprologus brichardi TaxID=32507 RepID=A0A3Q4H5V7_NEOBR